MGIAPEIKIKVLIFATSCMKKNTASSLAFFCFRGATRIFSMGTGR
jgi:hypothetical protein